VNTTSEQFYIADDQITIWHKLLRLYFQRIGPITPRSTSRIFWHLFTRPRKRPLSATQRQQMSIAHSTAYQLKNSRSKYVVHTFGEGEQHVLICHGWESRTADFLTLIATLQKAGVVVHSIDFTGHGSAPKGQAHLPLFIAIIQEVIERHPGHFTSVIGHSLGAAALSMAIAYVDPKKVKKVIFLGLHPHPSAFLMQYKSVTRINDHLFNQCLAYAERKTGGKLLQYDCHHYIDQYKHFELLLVHDTMDRIIHVKRIRELATKIETAQVFEGNHGGHFSHYKHPEVIHYIERFIIT